MKKHSIRFSLIIVAVCMASFVLAAEEAHWGYWVMKDQSIGEN